MISLLAIAAVFISATYLSREEPARAPSPPTDSPVQVKTTIVEKKDVPRYLLLTGELEAEKESSVATNASGIVITIS